MKKLFILLAIISVSLKAQVKEMDILLKSGSEINTIYLEKSVLDTLPLPASSIRITGMEKLNIYIEKAPVTKADSSLGEIILGINFTAYKDIEHYPWNNVSIPDELELGIWEYLQSWVENKLYPLNVVQLPKETGFSNSNNEGVTEPSKFPEASKRRGLAILGNDTLGLSISKLKPNTYYHLSMYIRSSYGPDIFRVMAADTLDFKGAQGNKHRSYEIDVLTDDYGTATFYITSMNKGIKYPALSLNALYLREYNELYPYEGDDITPETTVPKAKVNLPTIENPEQYKRSGSLMDKSNIRHVLDVNKGWNVTFTDGIQHKESMYIHDGYAAMDIDQYVWDGDSCIGVVGDYFVKGWQLTAASSKSSQKFPWSIYLQLEREFRPKGLWVFDAGKYEVKGEWDDRWLTVYGMNVFGEKEVIADSIQGFGTNGWKWIPVQTKTFFKWFILEWNKVDGNGVSGNLFTNAPVIVVPSGEYGDVVPHWEGVPAYRNGKRFREHLSGNDLPDNNAEAFGALFPESRMYFDYERLVFGGAPAKYFMTPDLFGVDTSGRYDQNSKPIYKAGHYLMHPLRKRQAAGVEYQIIILQKNQRNFLSWDKESVSPYFMIQDSTWNSWAPHGDSTIVKIDLPESYDIRQDVHDALNNTTNYPVKNDSLQTKADFTYQYEGNTLKKNAVLEGIKLSHPKLWIDWADPAKRYSVMTDPYTHLEAAQCLFGFGAIYGHNKEIPRKDIENYLQPGQQFEVGQGLVHSVGMKNESGRDWKRSMSHYKAEWLAWSWSVEYDAHLGLLAGTYGNHAVGLWTADTSLSLNSGADIHMDAALIILACKYLKYIRQKRWDELKDHHHPYNGKLMRLLPKMDIDVHHYTSSNGGQGSTVNLYDPGAPYSHWIAPEKQHRKDAEYFAGWSHYSGDIAKDCKVSVSENNVDPNDGTQYAPRRKDIGVLKDEYKGLPEEDLAKIPTNVSYTWATAARSGGTGADSIDLSMSTIVCAAQRRNEEWFWKRGIPLVYLFTFRDPAYLGGNGGTVNDTNLWNTQGYVGGQFKFQGVFRKSKSIYKAIPNAMTPNHVNVITLLRDYEPWSYTENDSVYTSTWRNTLDTNQFIKRVWRPTDRNDTTYNVTIPLHPQAYDVAQINCYVNSYEPYVEPMGDVPAVREDVIICEKMFRYKVKP